MIDLYYWTTPNGHKMTIFLDEAGLPYKIRPVNLQKNEQHAPDFLKISPNNKMPAMIDHEPKDGKGPLSMFESGAMLWYLAEKCGKFIPDSPRDKAKISEWLFWQVGGLGPMLGQHFHFTKYAPEKVPYAIDRFTTEANRLYTVLNKQLEGRAYVVGEYSIVDMAIYPWIVAHQTQAQNLANFQNVKRWVERVAKRPAVERAYALAKTINPNL